MFAFLKKMYDAGRYTAEMVHNAVDKGWITEAQYNEIVGA